MPTCLRCQHWRTHRHPLPVIAATIYNPPDDEAPDDEAPDDRDDADWCSVNGAWMIIEVFPEDDPRDGRPMYDSIEDAFSEPELTLAPAERD